MKITPVKIFLTLISAVVIVAGQSVSAAPSVMTEKAIDKLNITMGGRLYDNWPEVLLKEGPANKHPAYPSSGEEKGVDTWRCANCHGWDYKGIAGVKGVFGMIGDDPAKIKAIIRDKTHGYTAQMLSDQAVAKLADFVSAGQVDMDKYIDRATMTIKGDIERGKHIFLDVCAICHGDRGKGINFSGDNDNPEYIGTVAKEETLLLFHRIRNGMPGQPMVSLITLPTQTQVDVMAYERTLPVDDNDGDTGEKSLKDYHDDDDKELAK